MHHTTHQKGCYLGAADWRIKTIGSVSSNVWALFPVLALHAFTLASSRCPGTINTTAECSHRGHHSIDGSADTSRALNHDVQANPGIPTKCCNPEVSES